jgi:hypothetical protein
MYRMLTVGHVGSVHESDGKQLLQHQRMLMHNGIPIEVLKLEVLI